LLSNPELVGFPSVAFKVASWFWKENAFIITSNEKAVKGNLTFLFFKSQIFHSFKKSCPLILDRLLL
jgi:hypothetical protein